MRRGAACQLMRRDESAPGRTRASSLLAVQFWATWREHMEALCLEHLCQTLSYWSQFSQEQADRGFLRRTTTQVILLVSQTEMAFLGLGEPRATGCIRALLGQVSGDSAFRTQMALVMSRGETESRSSPNRFFPTSSTVTTIITNNTSQL